MALSLFTYEHTSLARPANDPGRLALGQYPTPIWVAEHLVERYFPDLDNNDCVLEPTCGPGHFLQTIPVQVPAFGIEIDPTLTELARRRTGREIICGDALTIDPAIRPTVLVGNPPFQSEFIDRLLERAHEWLPAGGRAGFILPAYGDYCLAAP